MFCDSFMEGAATATNVKFFAIVALCAVNHIESVTYVGITDRAHSLPALGEAMGFRESGTQRTTSCAHYLDGQTTSMHGVPNLVKEPVIDKGNFKNCPFGVMMMLMVV